MLHATGKGAYEYMRSFPRYFKRLQLDEIVEILVRTTESIGTPVEFHQCLSKCLRGPESCSKYAHVISLPRRTDALKV